MRCGRHLVCLFVVLLSACGGYPRWDYTPGRSHIVRSGETLSNIATRYGRDHRDLARWNNLGDGSLIYPGDSPDAAGRHRGDPAIGQIQTRAEIVAAGAQ